MGIVELASVPANADPSTILTRWPFDPVTILFLLAAGSVYGAGLRRVAGRGQPHPRSFAIAFYAGLASLALVLGSPLETYADVSFGVHMAQHLLLTLLAPPLLALGAPVTLALRASKPELARRLTRALRSRIAAALSNPVVGWALFVGVAYSVHLSRLFDTALRNDSVHASEHAVWLGAALLFWWPIVGRDPSPHPMSYPARLLSLFLVMPAMSFLALTIYSARRPLNQAYASLPAPWGPNALTDQHGAAVMMWLVGNLALVVAAAWKRDEDARQRRIEARELSDLPRPASP